MRQRHGGLDRHARLAPGREVMAMPSDEETQGHLLAVIGHLADLISILVYRKLLLFICKFKFDNLISISNVNIDATKKSSIGIG
jgi:hypothetical protein